MDMRQVLEVQSDRIEAVLSLHKVPARVTGGTVTPRWVRFQVLPAVGAKVSRIKNLSEELAAALGTSPIKIYRRGAAVAVEVPRDDPQPVRLLSLYNQLKSGDEIPPVAAILGLAEDGAPLLIRLPSKDVGHILISGEKGAGKTTLLRSIVISLMLSNDSSKVAFVFLGNTAPLSEVARGLGYLTMGPAEIGLSSVIPMALQAIGKCVIVVADDVFSKDNENSSIVSTMARILGRDNWHFILSWNGVPPDAVSNLFKVRLVGKVSSVEDACIATGFFGMGAERLLGKGDFLAIVEDDRFRFQAAYISETDVNKILSSRCTLEIPSAFE